MATSLSLCIVCYAAAGECEHDEGRMLGPITLPLRRSRFNATREEIRALPETDEHDSV